MRPGGRPESVHGTTEMRRRFGGRPRSGTVHRTTLAPRPPPARIPRPPFIKIPRGAAARGDESRADVSWVRRRGGIFQSAWAGRC
jgi:hypothetical protein